MKILITVGLAFAVNLTNEDTELPILNMQGFSDLTPEKVAAWNPFESIGFRAPRQQPATITYNTSPSVSVTP